MDGRKYVCTSACMCLCMYVSVCVRMYIMYVAVSVTVLIWELVGRFPQQFVWNNDSPTSYI